MNTHNAPDIARRYHDRSKHRFEAYAPGPGFLDWETQPDPFRTFRGAPLVPLPLATGDRRRASWADLHIPGAIAACPLNPDTLGRLLQGAFGLSAWKEIPGSRWALRCNPSSGNLHPTEAYVALGPGQPELAAGVYHYRPYDHALEQRCRAALPLDGCLIGLSAVHWREAWKYGERAFRYCQHDIGHALAALRMAAGLLGWQVRLLDDWGDGDIARLLGLDRDGDFADAEREAADLLCRVGPGAGPAPAIDPLLDAAAAGTWMGHANRLSPAHRHDWPLIETVHAATRKPRTRPLARAPAALLPVERTPRATAAPTDVPAWDILQQRRSAQAFDGITAISRQTLWTLLAATLPGAQPPLDVWTWPPRVHLLLFVHRVEGLAPGLYLCPRRADAEAPLRAALRPEFEWAAVPDAPDGLRLLRLAAGPCGSLAQRLACHQDIASDGAFSLGMLAEFDAALADGAWQYRRLFWECGLIGQALYLEAELAGVRGTGIGCFFDDGVHALLGLGDTRYQSLYHFTVGRHREDHRLRTLPPYAHLDARAGGQA